MYNSNVYLKKISQFDKYEFKQKIQESFSVGLYKNFNNVPIIPSDEELEKVFNSPDNDIYCIYLGIEKVGGAVVNTNNQTFINSLELFFIYKDKHHLGLGFKAWKSIEEQYPKTKIWKTITPYFEKRNIHFYVNKCGFKIIEFCNDYHINKNYKQTSGDDVLGENEFFVFEKIMQ